MNKSLTIIAAFGKNNELGKENKLLWHLPADFKHFKEKTTGHCIIMGRKTYESIGKPLPKRTNIIITRSKTFQAPGCIVTNSLKEALKYTLDDSNPFVIGGGQIYKDALPLATNLEITEVHANFEADAYFPPIDNQIWEETNREQHLTDEKHQFNFDLVSYRLKNCKTF